MKVSTVPEIDVVRLMQGIRDELSGHNRRSATSHGLLGPIELFLPDPESVAAAAASLPVRKDNSYAVTEFLQYEDADFIHAAYRGILNRAADSGGFERYLEILRRGASKVEILGRIRYSPEGKSRGTRVQGLAGPFVLDWISRLPIVGRPVAIIIAMWNGPVTERGYRRLASELAHWRAQSQRDAARSTRLIHEALHTLEESENQTRRLLREVANTRLEELRQTLTQTIAALRALQVTVGDSVDRESIENEVNEARPKHGR